ncbi:MAG: DUF3298 domain-containing protein [Oscillospiraceae bacterium]|nr:DUF3298 domain-containing protein [Oscillospiraceae bacterium]
MKRILAILLLLTVLTGCVPTYEPAPTEPDVPTIPVTEATEPETTEPAETEPEPVMEQQPMVAVSVPHIIDIETKNDTLIFRKTTQSMHLTLRDPDVAEKIILDFLNRVDRHSTDAESVRQAAESDFTDNPDWIPYFFDLIYNPTRVDHSVLSLYGEAVSYSGGNHPIPLCTAANYNIVTGDVLTLGSILYHIDSKDALVDLVIKNLDAIAEEKYLLDGYEDAVRKRFNRDESFDEDWYFTDDSLCFYFAPYEIAPYTSGVIVAEIPYSELTGIIADEFFPAEEDISEGTIVSAPLDKADMDQFSQIAEVTIDQDGDMVLLYTTGAVRNVRIQSGTVNADNGEFTAVSTIFGTYTLTPGDAIMLKIAITDTMPALQLSYESGGELHHIILSESFLNG